MGGPGSGNWYRWNVKETTESHHSIDIYFLRKRGCLMPGTMGTLSWSHHGRQTGVIGYRMETERVILNYRHRSNGGDWEDVEQEIRLEWTPCTLGGRRAWFICPGCGVRRAMLYGAGKYFLCRCCYNLNYASQHEGRCFRLLRKAQKIRARLGASTDISKPILSKPKGMHWKTFYRLRQKEGLTNMKAVALMDQYLSALKRYAGKDRFHQ